MAALNTCVALLKWSVEDNSSLEGQTGWQDTGALGVCVEPVCCSELVAGGGN